MPKALIFATIAGVVAAAAAGGVFALRGGVDVHDPSAVWSPTHALNSGTSHASAVVRWTATADADAYSILWSHEEALPDKVAELPGSATRTTRVLSPGRWWFNLRTRGANGKWTSSVHLGPLVVLPLPETSIVDGPARASSDATPAFRVSATRGGAFECSLDGAAFEGCPHGQDFARLRDGRHTVAIRLRDVFGSVDPTPAVWRWRIDTRAPDARILSTETDDDRARFEFKAGGPGAKFECRLDDAEFARCRSPKKYANLSEGTHRFQVAAIDAAGNRDPKPAERTWKVDTRAPETSIVSGPTGVVDSVTARFTFDTTEDEVTFECRLDGRAFRQCTSPKTFRGLASGAHTFRVRARDAAGNIDASPATRRWTVAVADLVAPKTTITSVATSGRKATIKFKSSEAGSTFECRLDGGAWAACSSPKAYSGLALGAHIVRVRARDGAGNIDATPAAANFSIP